MRLDDAAARAVALIAIAGLALGGCGGDESGDGAGPLRWQEPPQVLTNPTLPDDRILQGRVVNESLRPVELAARDVRAEDADGERMEASVAFLSGFGRAWEVYNKGPLDLPDDERRRLGKLVRIEPGRDAPLVVSWRGAAPERLTYAGGTLTVPR